MRKGALRRSCLSPRAAPLPFPCLGTQAHAAALGVSPAIVQATPLSGQRDNHHRKGMATASGRQDKHKEQHSAAKERARMTPASELRREGGKKREGKGMQLSLSPGSSKKCSALQPETCPKYFTPPLLYPQLWGSWWIIHREEGAGCAQSSTKAGSFAR